MKLAIDASVAGHMMVEGNSLSRIGAATEKLSCTLLMWI